MNHGTERDFQDDTKNVLKGVYGVETLENTQDLFDTPIFNGLGLELARARERRWTS